MIMLKVKICAIKKCSVVIVGRSKKIEAYILQKGANLWGDSDIKDWNTTDKINEMLRAQFK